MTRVLYRTESLPPIHSVWLTDPPLYVAGFLTVEARARYVEGHGWEVIAPAPDDRQVSSDTTEHQ